MALIAGPVLCALLLVLPAPEAMPPEAGRLVALTAWMVILWVGEAVPIPLMPLLGNGDMDTVAVRYGNPLLFLFLGGFLLAAAMERWGLHRRIALTVVKRVGSRADRIIGGFMAATALLSM